MEFSAIVITKNEEKNIYDCLKSLDFANEVILVDSGSTDKTLEIARSFSNVKIIETEWFGYVKNKEIAIDQAKHDWIFWIDADEVVTAQLRNEWIHFLNSELSKKYIAVDMPRKSFVLGHFMRYAGWYPDRITRFFNKKYVHFSPLAVHEHLVLASNKFRYSFQNDLLHYSYRSLDQFFSKMQQYGKLGGYDVYKKKAKVSFYTLIYKPIWSFLRAYIFQRGFLDGKVGFIVCVGTAITSFIKYSHAYMLFKD